MSTNSDRGLFVWHELNTTDTGSAERFYSTVIGWKTKSWDPNPAYKMWMVGREPRGGLYAVHEEPNALPLPPHWLSYIGTPDVDASVRQAVELGGKVVTPAYDVPGVARMAVLQDPQGAMFAVSAQVERSSYEEAQLGDFSWHELLTTNWQTAFDFYSKLFGWEKMTAMDMGPAGIYQMYGVGGNALGGMFAPGGLTGGPLWVPYARVRDAKRAAETAKGLGAAIVHGPAEVPGGDWIFTGVDREGAMFAVHSKKRAAPEAKGPASAKAAVKRATGVSKTAAPARKGKKGVTTKGSKRAKTAKTPKKKTAKAAAGRRRLGRRR